MKPIPTEPKTCILCGRVTTRPPGLALHLWEIRKLCGMQCRAAWLKINKVGFQPGHAGYKNSGSFQKGFTPWNRGKPIQTNDALKRWYEAGNSWNRGKKLTGKQLEAVLISIKKAQANPPRGKDHWNWKGGKSRKLRKKIQRLKLYRDWRSSVFTRDNFTCQKCGRRGGYLQAHHLVSFQEILDKHKIRTAVQARACPLLWDVENGQTLCSPCHYKTDTFGSKQLIVKKDYKLTR